MRPWRTAFPTVAGVWCDAIAFLAPGMRRGGCSFAGRLWGVGGADAVAAGNFFGCEAFYLKRGAYLYGCGVSFGPALRVVVRCANSDARRREFRIARQTDDAL